MVDIAGSDTGSGLEAQDLLQITDWTPSIEGSTFAVYKDNLLVWGAATIWIADFGATEPVGLEALSSQWVDLGGTLGGVSLKVKNTYETSETLVQEVNLANSRLKKREMSVATELAEPTLTSLMYSVNGGTSASGSGYTSYTPPAIDRATVLTYKSVIVEGWAPGISISAPSRRRRVILRKCLSIEDVEMAYTETDQTTLPITWSVHRVDNTTAPFKLIDEV